MNENERPRPKGLPLNSTAPLIKTSDIYGNIIDFSMLLKENNGILIDFFRGNW
jgi:hypothetical protein